MKRRKPKSKVVVAKPLPLPIWCCRGGPMDGKAFPAQGRMVDQMVLASRGYRTFTYYPKQFFKGDSDLLVIIATMDRQQERAWKRIAPKP